MENKYYTPELEEFHSGFEFEYIHPISEYDKENEWTSHNWEARLATLTINADCISIGGFTIKPNKIRVKILDREDIESLGWDYDLDSTVRCEYKDYMLYNFNNSNIFTIKAKRGFVKYGQAFVGFDILFEGVIKNKSELKKLMKQLNIL
jgi:hypothetical protein